MKAKMKNPVAALRIKRQGFVWYIFVFNNLTAITVAGTILFTVITIDPGYKFVYTTLLKENMAIIYQYPNLTLEQKYEVKLGNSYTYLLYLKENTPENAVILYPGSKDFFPPNIQSAFSGEVFNKIWAIRFLYPRKLVIPSEINKSHFSNEITHVAIVNGKGFENLRYIPTTYFDNGVLPISRFP